MRTVRADLAGMSFDMPVSWAAMQRLTDFMGGDPLEQAVKQARGEITWSPDMVVTVLLAGVSCTAAGASMTREEMQQAVIDAGMGPSQAKAVSYLTAFVAGPATPFAASGGASGGKGQAG